MTTFSQIVTLLGAVGGVGVLAVMAFAPVLLDLPERRTDAPGLPAPAAPVAAPFPAPAIPAQRVPVEPVTGPAPRAALAVGPRA